MNKLLIVIKDELRNYVFVLCFFVFSAAISAQQPNFKFNHLNLEDGLSNLNISSFAKDELGFIWIGTEDGLNRYDGTNLKVFKSYGADSINGIKNNNISSLFASDNYVFIGSVGAGIDCYDLIHDEFKHYSYIDNKGKVYPNSVARFCKLQNGNILVASSSGIHEFDYNKKVLQPFFTEKLSELANLNVQSILEDADGKIWLGTDNDVFCISADRTSFTHYQTILKVKVDHHWVQNIIQGPDKKFYVFKQNYLFIIDQNFEKIILKKQFSNYIPEGEFDFLGRLWIVGDGLVLYENENFRYIENDPLDPNSLSDNIGKSVFVDNDGTIWYGSWNNGISYFNPAHQSHSIKNIIYRSDNKGLPNNPVDFVFEDTEQQIWVGTNWGGITIYNPDSEKLEFLSSDNQQESQISANLNYSAIQKNDTIWIGTFREGLDCYHAKTKKITNYPIPVIQGRMPKINKILTDSLSSNNLLLCTEAGFISFNTKTGESFYYQPEKFNLPNNQFVDMCYLNKSTIIIAVDKAGLYLFNLTQNTFSPYLQNQIKSNLISTVIFDTEKNLLLAGAQNGLHIFDNITKRTFHYNIGKGLPNENVVSILKESRGYYWLGTLNGLCMLGLNRQTNGEIIISNIRNLYKSDGLAGNQFRAKTSILSSKGEALFGTNSGLSIFYPEIFSFDTESPRVLISELKISNQSVNVIPDYRKAVLQNSIFYTDEIELSHQENSISFEFTALDFFLKNNVEYRYKLEGFDNDWIKTHNRTAVYTNLNPGNYVFKVDLNVTPLPSAFNGTTINVFIKPPFYRTPYFRFGLTSFLLLAFFSFYFLRLRYYKQRHVQLEEMVSQRTHQLEVANKNLEEKNIEIQSMAERVHEADEMKLRFFVNVHHEFRTSLSLIIGPVEQILKHKITDPKIAQDLRIIAGNSKRLLTLVNEILEYRKIDAGKIKLNLVKCDVIIFLKNIKSLFDVKAQQQKIKYNFRSSIESAEIYFDSNKFENIIFNLLSNAFKYTNKKGEITLEVKQLNSTSNLNTSLTTGIPVKIMPQIIQHNFNTFIEIAVIDNGIGFNDEGQIRFIWERFYQMPGNKRAQNSGSGIGLAITKELTQLHHGLISAESNKTGGATFKIWFPSQENWFSQFADLQIQNGIQPATTRIVDINEELYQNKTGLPVTKKVNAQLPTILVIEDNIEIHHFLNNHLTEYNLEFAICGNDGLKTAKIIVPDLIVCDIMLPDFHGYHIVKELKQHVATSHIPIVMLTALVSEDNIIKALNIGADDYVTKPFTINMLKARINNLLNLREKLREIYSLKSEIIPEELTSNPVDKDFFYNLNQIIISNLDNYELSVEYLAELLGMNRVQLYRKVNSITKKGPAELIRKIKLNYSKQMLSEKKIPIADIAVKIGYSESSSFNRAFLQEFGISPSNFQKKHFETGENKENPN